MNDKIAPWRNYLLAHTSDHPLGPESLAPTWRYAQPSPLRPALITCATLPSGRLPAYDHFVILIGPNFQNRLFTGFFDWLCGLAFSFLTVLLYSFVLFSSFVFMVVYCNRSVISSMAPLNSTDVSVSSPILRAYYMAWWRLYYPTPLFGSVVLI